MIRHSVWHYMTDFWTCGIKVEFFFRNNTIFTLRIFRRKKKVYYNNKIDFSIILKNCFKKITSTIDNWSADEKNDKIKMIFQKNNNKRITDSCSLGNVDFSAVRETQLEPLGQTVLFSAAQYTAGLAAADTPWQRPGEACFELFVYVKKRGKNGLHLREVCEVCARLIPVIFLQPG